MYFIESNISINMPHPTYVDRGTCRCSGLGPVWFDAWEFCVDIQHTHLGQKLCSNGAANPAKSDLREYRAHNWIEIQGYFSWGQQRHILGI